MTHQKALDKSGKKRQSSSEWSRTSVEIVNYQVILSFLWVPHKKTMIVDESTIAVIRDTERLEINLIDKTGWAIK